MDLLPLVHLAAVVPYDFFLQGHIVGCGTVLGLVVLRPAGETFSIVLRVEHHLIADHAVNLVIVRELLHRLDEIISRDSKQLAVPLALS
jgi:hypothetical protein